MKKKLLFAALYVASALGFNANAEDVTSKYLKNADFSSGTPIDNHICTYGKDMEKNGTTYYGAQPISDWTNASVGSTDSNYENCTIAGGLFAYGSEYWLAGEGHIAPAQGLKGGSGNAAGLCSVWGGTIQYTQDVTLEAGCYTIRFNVFNATTGTTSGKIITSNLFGFVPNEGKAIYASNNTFAIGQWTTVSVSFKLESATSGKISMGYKGPNGNNDMPHLFVDNVTILKQTDCTDYTSKFGIEKDDWVGATDGLQGSGWPTADGRTAKMAANYSNSYVGTKIYQNVTGLEPGMYEVELYAISQQEWGAGGAKLQNDAGDAVCVLAEGKYTIQKSWINARRGPGFPANGPGIYSISEVAVTDGNLTLGISVEKEGQTEWHHIQIKSLTRVGDVDVDAFIGLIAEKLEIANSIKNTPMNATVLSGLNNAISGAEGYEENKDINQLGEILTSLKNAIDAAQISIDNYAAALAILNAASTLDDIGQNVYKEGATVKEIQTAYDERTLEAVTLEQKNACNETLFEAVRSQTAYGADMTLAIVNPGFEAGDFSGWTNNSLNIQSNGEAIQVGKYYAESWQPNGKRDIKQTIVQLPANKYKLTVDVMARGIKSAKVYAGESVQDVTISDEITTYEVEFTCEDQKDVEIGFEGEGTGANASWIAIDNFTLTLIKDLYAITVEKAENGTVTVDAEEAYEGKEVKVTAEAAPDYELVSITVTTESGKDVTVTDGAFTMPNEAVTVTAVFDYIYIETDVTAQFPVDFQGWKGATGFAEWAAPKVETNDGRSTFVCEKFDGASAALGEVFTRTLTGLTNGTYRIELYGAAASTKGRDADIDTEMTESNDGDTDAVYLYAKTADGTVKQYIPVNWATDFNGNGVATAVLNGVEITDGTVELGMYSEKKYTNWHVVQIKGVTATVIAKDYLAAAVAKAEELEGNIPDKLYTEVTETVAENNKAYATADEYVKAVEAIEAKVAEAIVYIDLAAILKEGEAIKANVAEGNSAIETYDAAIADVKAAYDAATVEDFAAAIATVEEALPALAKAQTAPNSDMKRVISNWDFLSNLEGWEITGEGNNKGYLTNTIREYWKEKPADGKFDYYQVLTDLPTGKYTISAAMFNTQEGEPNGNAGVYGASANGSVFAGVTEVSDQNNLSECTTEVIDVCDGTLRLGVKNNGTMSARWFGVDWIKLTLVEAVASYSIEVEESENGTIATDVANAFEGDVVSITAEPAEGYELAEVTVTGASGETVEVEIDEWTGAMSFTMPAEAVTVKATFQEAYVKLSNYALACDGEFDEDDAVKVVVTYDAEIVGSYAESFMLDAVFEYEVKDAEGNVVASGEKNPTPDDGVAGGVVYIYVSNLKPNTEYTVTITSVKATDFDTSIFETVTIYTEEGELPSLKFTTESLYDITVAAAENGTVEVSATTAAEGDKVTITATPAEKYEIGDVKVTTASGTDVEVTTDEETGEISFIMPAEAVTVTVTFTVPTGVANVEAAPAVKADGKYLENGQIVIYRGGVKYNAAGAVIR